jgi:ribosome modulation factor
MQLAEQVTDDGVGPTRQVLQQGAGLAANRLGLQRQHVSELRQQPADAVDAGSARLHVALPGTMHHELALLLLALQRHEAHVGALHRLADRRRVGGVGLAAHAAHTVRGDELRGDQPHGVTARGKQPCPVVSTGARLHRHGAWRQRGDQLVQPRARHTRAYQRGLAKLIHTVHRKHVLGEIDANEDNGHGLPLLK